MVQGAGRPGQPNSGQRSIFGNGGPSFAQMPTYTPPGQAPEPQAAPQAPYPAQPAPHPQAVAQPQPAPQPVMPPQPMPQPQAAAPQPQMAQPTAQPQMPQPAPGQTFQAPPAPQAQAPQPQAPVPQAAPQAPAPQAFGGAHGQPAGFDAPHPANGMPGQARVSRPQNQPRRRASPLFRI